MQTNIQTTGQTTTVQIIGELDTIATTEQADELQGIIDRAKDDLIINCARLEYISSAGLRFFMQLKRASEAHHSNLQVINLNQDVSDIFRMSGFNNIFNIN